MRLIKIESFGRTHYINPKYIVSVQESSVSTVTQRIPFNQHETYYEPCVSIATVKETYSCSEDLATVLAKIKATDE